MWIGVEIGDDLYSCQDILSHTIGAGCALLLFTRQKVNTVMCFHLEFFTLGHIFG